MGGEETYNISGNLANHGVGGIYNEQSIKMLYMSHLFGISSCEVVFLRALD